MHNKHLYEVDPEVFQAIYGETDRQAFGLELIASENFVPEAVLEAAGSVLTNKYAEGYPGKRYYGGCEFVDQVERLAIDRAKKLFGADHANVQPHSGTSANIATYLALINPGDTIFGLNLSHGGHLSHGHPINFSGKYFKVIQYGVDQKTEMIDYAALRQMALEHRPRLIMCGGSAYPRTLHFDKFREICDEIGAFMVADIAHIAGLIAAGLHPSPVPFADVVTTTTHKTLRGPRSGLILCKEKYAKDIDRSIFPGNQGGPLEHIIAAKAVCFKLAMTDEFKEYQRQVIRNAVTLSGEIQKRGYRIVAGGTDTHLFLVDLRPKKVTGKVAQEELEKAGITVNKNTIPFDTEKPMITSGIRIGTPALTTRGMKEPEMVRIADLIDQILSNVGAGEVYERVRADVKALCQQFPLYKPRLDEYRKHLT